MDFKAHRLAGMTMLHARWLSTKVITQPGLATSVTTPILATAFRKEALEKSESTIVAKQEDEATHYD